MNVPNAFFICTVMNWIILFTAGLFEVAMTFSLGKTRSAEGTTFVIWVAAFLLSAAISMGLLAKAIQTLPLGTSYAIWTGIGALGTVLVGIFVFGEPVTFLRLLFTLTLFGSIVGLKIVA